MDALAAEEQEMIDSETEMCLVSWKLNYRQCWASRFLRLSGRTWMLDFFI